MAADPLAELLERLTRVSEGGIPTSGLGRLRRSVSAGARVGLGALSARLRGRNGGLGALSADTLAHLAESLGELKGVAMKVGQILSYVDGSLPPEARALLAVLQKQSQPTPFVEIEQTIREDLGERAPALLASLGREPVAAASVGQVYRAILDDGTPAAVKVRHPGIDAAIRADFKTAALGKVMARLVAPGANVAEVMAEAEQRFLEECDYALEARRQERFATLYAGHPTIAIPAVRREWCGARVLTTHWCEGLGLEELVALGSAEARGRASRALYEFYVGTLYRHGLFNADPHPGNLLFDADGRLTVLDHGCVREFEGPLVAALAALSRATRAGDVAAMQDSLARLGMPRPGVDFDVTQALLRGFYAPLLVPGPHAIVRDRAFALGETAAVKRTLMRLHLPGRLLFLFRIRFGLYAVLARLGAELDWAALEEECCSAVA